MIAVKPTFEKETLKRPREHKSILDLQLYLAQQVCCRDCGGVRTTAREVALEA